MLHALGKPSTEVDALRQSACARAEALLREAEDWKPRLADDNIWQRATQAEAHLLCGRWHDAACCYLDACNEQNAQPQHPQTMKAQAQRIAQAYQMLGAALGPPCDDLDGLFGPPPA